MDDTLNMKNVCRFMAKNEMDKAHLQNLIHVMTNIILCFMYNLPFTITII